MFACFSACYWFFAVRGPAVTARVPIPENDPALHERRADPNANKGTLVPGKGKPSGTKGSWPGFRGPRRNGIAAGTPIASRWPAGGPKVLWKVDLGEGHAGAAVRDGRVYFLDYDQEKKEDAVRCLSLDDGEEIWRYTYYVKIKRNHGMSRTVPAVNGGCIVTLGPKCHVHCLNAVTGELLWKKDLVAEYGAKVPEWYAGECPLIDGGRVVLATGGRCLLTALNLSDGKTLWETPNERGWEMTHSSVIAVEFEGKRQYVWCASGGVVGVDAASGKVLWRFPGWKIKIANVPTPVDLGGGRIFLSGGYNTGSMLIKLVRAGGAIQVEKLFRIEEKDFASLQQTPIFYNGLIYGVTPEGKKGHLACLSPEGKVLWVDKKYDFGLGPYLMVNGKLLVLDDHPAELYLFDVDSTGAKRLARHRVLEGFDAWAPMAFVSGRVILRDSKTAVCLDMR